MKKLLVTILILCQLFLNGFLVFRIEKADHDVDRLYSFVNDKVVDTVNLHRTMLLFLRSEIADIMIELTRKGYLEPLPPEPTPKATPDVPEDVPAGHNNGV